MTFAEIVKIISDNGTSIILMAYFLYKDYKFNENIMSLLGEVKNVLIELKTWHAAEGGE